MRIRTLNDVYKSCLYNNLSVVCGITQGLQDKALHAIMTGIIKIEDMASTIMSKQSHILLDDSFNAFPPGINYVPYDAIWGCGIEYYVDSNKWGYCFTFAK